jgi:uncharacterized protein YwqG
MNRAETLQALRAAGLGRLMPDLERLVQDSIRLASRPGGAPLAVGATKLGGLPDLPGGLDWPAMGGGPMSFVAQIRLEEVAPLAPPGWLPPGGLLSFFYDQHQETYGASPADRGSWKVIHLQGGGPDAWRPRPFPDGLGQNARFSACALAPASEATLPYSPSDQLAGLAWSEEEIGRYEDFLAAYPNPQDHASLHHRMFGHPEQIQDDMQLQSALYANGFEDLGNPSAARFLARKAEWQLLLQVDSETNAGMRWASSGRLYFWIEQGALLSRAFERVWAVLQSE